MSKVVDFKEYPQAARRWSRDEKRLFLAALPLLWRVVIAYHWVLPLVLWRFALDKLTGPRRDHGHPMQD